MKGFDKDIFGAIILTFLTLFFVFLAPFSQSLLRVVLGLPFVLFLPGYTLIAALFPRDDDLDGIERLALSFGLSIAVVPLIGLFLNYTPFGIRLAPVALSLSIFTLTMAFSAQLRRDRLSPEERFKPDLGVTGIFEGVRKESGWDKTLSILLILSIITAVGALVYVVVTPKQGEHFTEFFILGPEGKAAGYPTDLFSNNTYSIRVGIVNNEFESVNYTLLVNLENSSLYADSITLSHNRSYEDEIAFTPTIQGDNLKLEFLLYKNHNMTSPYRSLHLWVDVQ